MEVIEIRMLRWMYGNTLMDRIRNQEFRNKLGVASISAKMCENRLRWFGHVKRKTFDVPVRRIISIIVEGERSRGKPRRTWDKQIKVDLHELHLSVDLSRDRWRFRVVLGVFAPFLYSMANLWDSKIESNHLYLQVM
ncbi:uncharacterized protein LOC130799261 [Amaranthus tricolor]|uniref:uncharacterized protein LOC130799261 n=1 Tax=Amaranthus tricolor TaxID=29722 RepID=UPI00258D8EF9|nr:uncharacterized protein LOC130799261 [Amaranthus tricolor]